MLWQLTRTSSIGAANKLGFDIGLPPRFFSLDRDGVWWDIGYDIISDSLECCWCGALMLYVTSRGSALCSIVLARVSLVEAKIIQIYIKVALQIYSINIISYQEFTTLTINSIQQNTTIIPI